MRAQFRGRWTRPPSQALTRQLIDQAQSRRETLDTAQKADQLVRGKIETWSEIIEVLCLPFEELERSIPSAIGVRGGGNDSGSPDGSEESVTRLKRLLDDVDTQLRVRRERVEEVRRLSESDDISPALLNQAAVLTSNSPSVKIEPAQFEDLFVTQMQKYEDFKKIVAIDEASQEKLLKEIANANTEFVRSRRSNAVIAKREKALQNLEQGYLKFKEVRTNLLEGMKVNLRISILFSAHSPFFISNVCHNVIYTLYLISQFYGEFEKSLLQLRGNCRDYCYARKIETKEYLE